MSLWPCGTDQQRPATAEDLIRIKKTVLREAIASGTVANVHSALESLHKANADIAEVFQSDVSLLQTLGSRVVRSHLVAARTLLDTIAEFEPQVLLMPNKNGKTLADEIAAFAEHYKMPSSKKAALAFQLSDRGIVLPENTQGAGMAK
jgi:hypothetical protein